MKKAVVTGLIWSVINCLLLYLITILDSLHPNSVGFILLSIPVGIINCASIINSFYRLRQKDLIQFIYFLFGLANGILFLLVLNQLQSLSGSMTN